MRSDSVIGGVPHGERPIPDTEHAIQTVDVGRVVHNREKAVPRPGPYQVLMRTEACGLCFSDTTLKMLRRMNRVYPESIRLVETGLVDLQCVVSASSSLDQDRPAFASAAAREGLKHVLRP